MVENKPKSKLRIVLTAAILLLLLVGLPMGSWYYLQSGLEYRQTALAELREDGEIPDFSLQTYKDEPFGNENIAGRLVVASFIDFTNESLATTFGETLAKLHDQFDARNEVAFLMHIMDTTATVAQIESFAKQYELEDQRQCYFLKGDPAIFKTLAHNGYKMPDDGDAMPYFALADTSSTVRRQYDVRQPEEIKRLVEHIAMILPRSEGRTVSINRDSE